jgi:hypothetical protein
MSNNNASNAIAHLPRTKTETIVTAMVNDGNGKRLVYGSFNDFFRKTKEGFVKRPRFSNIGKTITRSRLQFNKDGSVRVENGNPVYEPVHCVSTTLAL